MNNKRLDQLNEAAYLVRRLEEYRNCLAHWNPKPDAPPASNGGYLDGLLPATRRAIVDLARRDIEERIAQAKQEFEAM